MAFYEVEIADEILPNLVLSVETDWFRNPISSDRTSGVNNVFQTHS